MKRFCWVVLWGYFVCIRVVACSIEVPSDRYYITFFDASIYTLFPYPVCFFKPEENTQSDEPLIERHAANLYEWQQFCSRKPPLEDVAYIVYELPAVSVEEIRKAGKTIALTNNLFLKNLLQQPNGKAALSYLALAKRIEPHVKVWKTDWGSIEIVEPDLEAMGLLMEEAIQGAKATKNEFLRLRYAFQAVRLAHYTGNYQRAIELCNQLIEPLTHSSNPKISQSVVLGWALALKVGAYYRLKQHPEAIYAYSRAVAHHCDNQELRVFRSDIGSEEDWTTAMRMAKNEDEKVMLLYLRAAGVKDLEAIYNLQPRSPLLTNWLLQTITNIEHSELSSAFTRPDEAVVKKADADSEVFYKTKWSIQDRMWAAYQAERDRKAVYRIIPPFPPQAEASLSFWERIKAFFSDLWKQLATSSTLTTTAHAAVVKTVGNPTLNNEDYIRELQTFVEKGISEGQVSNLPTWQTVSAYLCYLSRQYEKASQTAQEVINDPMPTRAMKQQAQLIDALSRLATASYINTDLENRFYEVLKDKQPPRPEGHSQYNHLFNYSIYSRTLNELAQHYWQLNELPKAVLCFEAALELPSANALIDFLATDSELKNLSNLLAHPKSNFERWLVKQSRFTPTKMTDIRATKWMREGEYEKALTLFNQLPKDYWLQEDTTNAYNYTDSDVTFFSANFLGKKGALDPDSPYSKQTFAEKVVELLKKARQEPEKADLYYFQIANGFAYTPYWGYNYQVWKGSLVETFKTYYYKPGEYPLNVSRKAEQLYQADKRFKKVYGSLDKAIGFYKKAIETTQDAELAAEAAYNIQLCLLNPLTTIVLPETSHVAYGQLLTQNYCHTAFYQQKLMDCPILEYYQ